MKENDSICECGNNHKFLNQNIIVKEDCFNDFVLNVLKNKAKKYLIIYKQETKILANIFINRINENNIKFELLKLEKKLICVKYINKMQINAEYVIVLGDEQLVSAGKYLAKQYNLNLSVFLTGEFLDYTFSKFARLKSCSFYDFYVTKAPNIIYVDPGINKFNVNHVYYILSKYLAIFDGVVKECVYNKIECKKIKEFIKLTLVKYQNDFNKNNKIQNINNIWCLIRLGLAMNYFSQTSSFFGGEEEFINLLQVKNSNYCYLDLSYCALFLTLNAYLSFFRIAPTKKRVNLSLTINEICKFLNKPYITIINHLASTETLFCDKKLQARFYGYFYYLRAVLKKCEKQINKIIKKIDVSMSNYVAGLNKLDIIKSLCFAPCLSSSKNMLTLIFGFGYLNNNLYKI